MALHRTVSRVLPLVQQCPKPRRLQAPSRHATSQATAAAAACASSTTVDGNADSQNLRWLAASAAAAAVASLTIENDRISRAALMESKSSNDDDDDDDSTTILNWSGTHSVDLPPGCYHEPETESELIALVARAHTEGIHIRPVGSALSPNGLSFEKRGMVCLSNLDQVIHVDKTNMTVTVQAGARVSQLLDYLRPLGLTLPNLASIAEQQIGGIVSVGAHGTGAAIPPIDDFVTALTIVTPSRHGVVRMTEETHGETFRLARCGLGALGVLSEVTLKVVPAHRLVEQTVVLTRKEAKRQLATLLKRHRHVRYMWIPYEDCVIVVTNDDEADLPLAGPGTEAPDGKGGTKKVVTDNDLRPKHSAEEQFKPLRSLLASLEKSNPLVAVGEEVLSGLGFGGFRDLILAGGNMIDPEHIKKCNKAEHEFWVKSEGMRVAPSDKHLQFDCGGQQWVHEVCFPTGTYGIPSDASMDFMDEILAEIEKTGIAAHSPLEQRWSAASKSPLSPASVVEAPTAYDRERALFSWVGVIMYLPSEDMDPTGYRRQFITEAFQGQYCDIVRKIGKKYGTMCHWAKLELPEDAKDDDAEDSVARSVRGRFGPEAVRAFNEARKKYDPKGVLSSAMIDRVFGPSSDDAEK